MEAFSVKIKCGGCNRNKSRELFSGNALKKYKESQGRRARNPQEPLKTILCLACNNSNRDELQCSYCDRVMALDKFNKTQRRKGDNALCLDCSQEKVDREPDHQKEVDEVIIIDEIKASEIGAYAYTSSKLGSSELSRSRSASDQYETDTNPSSQYYIEGNDAVSLAGTGSSGFSSSSTRPTTGTGWDGFAGDDRTKSGTRSSSNNGFVKQNAVPRNPYEKARLQHERELKRTQERDDVVRDESDDSDDDDEAPY